MNGQWIGKFTGSNGDGNIVVNIDERATCYQGVAYTHPDNRALPNSAAVFKTKNKEPKAQLRTDALLPLDPVTANVTTWDAIKDKYPNLVFSQYADVTISLENEVLSLSWKTDIGATGNCLLPRSKAGAPSDLNATKSNWGDFKEYVSGLGGKRFLFRGQKDARRLRTSFHRTGRADLVRFRNEDVTALRNHLSARTKHVFNFGVPDEFGAFLNLIQHHGYPTPLLDWTYSRMSPLSSHTAKSLMIWRPRRTQTPESESLYSISKNGKQICNKFYFCCFRDLISRSGSLCLSRMSE